MFQLAKTLPYSTYEFTLFLNGCFCNVEPFLKLRELGIGACGTVRKSITKKLFPTFVPVNGAKTIPMDWGTIRGQVVEKKVLVTIWQDNSVVGFMSTVHTGQEYIVRQRRRPKNTSTNANTAQAPLRVRSLGTSIGIALLIRSSTPKELEHASRRHNCYSDQLQAL